MSRLYRAGFHKFIIYTTLIIMVPAIALSALTGNWQLLVWVPLVGLFILINVIIFAAPVLLGILALWIGVALLLKRAPKESNNKTQPADNNTSDNSIE